MKLRDYQVEAANSWRSSGYRSIFSMATGTGKTITAVGAIQLLLDEREALFQTTSIVVICPLIHLVDQWSETFRRQGWPSVKAYEDSSSWKETFLTAASKSALRPGSKLIIVTTQATFLGNVFQKSLSVLPGELVIIGDEVHNLGAKSTLEKLPQRAAFRLGLSATPERWGDDEGTKNLVGYFGDESFSMPIKEAISRSILCQYEYTLRMAPMDFEETDAYIDNSERLTRLLGGRDFSELSEAESKLAASLLSARSSILGNVKSKLTLFERDLLANQNISGQLIYCAEGSWGLQGKRQVDLVVDLIQRRKLGRAEVYDANTPREVRKEYLKKFALGEIKYLVSMRCLDEGVDVPEATIAYFLASSTNPRQFIQRRGRVLRKSKNKEFATIFDYFSAPDISVSANGEAVSNTLVKREISRALDFIDSSRNPAEALQILEPLRRQYDRR